MIHIKKLWLPLLIACNFVFSITGKDQTFRLSQFDHKSAAVLPTFTHRNIKWAILSREGSAFERILDQKLDAVETFIDPDNEYTWVVIAYDPSFAKASEGWQKNPRNVLYIVNFNKYKTKFFNKLKDRLAKVRWKDLKYAIINQENKHDPVTVAAYVLDPETHTFHAEIITLRPILVITLRPFFLGCDYEQGENEKIKYYNE